MSRIRGAAIAILAVAAVLLSGSVSVVAPALATGSAAVSDLTLSVSSEEGAIAPRTAVVEGELVSFDTALTATDLENGEFDITLPKAWQWEESAIETITSTAEASADFTVENVAIESVDQESPEVSDRRVLSFTLSSASPTGTAVPVSFKGLQAKAATAKDLITAMSPAVGVTAEAVVRYGAAGGEARATSDPVVVSNPATGVEPLAVPAPNVTLSIVATNDIGTPINDTLAGNPVNYSVKPVIGTPAFQFRNLELVVEVPAGFLSVTPATVPAGWNLIATSVEGDPMKGVSLRYIYNGTWPPATPLPEFNYSVQTSRLTPPGTGVTTSANLSLVDVGTSQKYPPVYSDHKLAINQSANTPPGAVIEKRVVGDSVVSPNGQVTWETTIYNNSKQVLSKTGWVQDVLPWDGDPRGSHFEGSYTVLSASVTRIDAPGQTPYQLSLETLTGHQAEAYRRDPVWGAFPGWASAAPGSDISSADGIRSMFGSALPPGGKLTLLTTVQLSGMSAGDRLTNTSEYWGSDYTPYECIESNTATVTVKEDPEPQATVSIVAIAAGQPTNRINGSAGADYRVTPAFTPYTLPLKDLSVVVDVPAGFIQVSLAPAPPGWTLVAEPVDGDQMKGVTLRYHYAGEWPSGVVFPDFSYYAVASIGNPRDAILTTVANFSAVNAETGENYTAPQATHDMKITQVSAFFPGTVVEKRIIGATQAPETSSNISTTGVTGRNCIEEPGECEIEWEITIYNRSPKDSPQGDFIQDVLPQDGLQNGSRFSGTYAVVSASLTASDDNGNVLPIALKAEYLPSGEGIDPSNSYEHSPVSGPSDWLPWDASTAPDPNAQGFRAQLQENFPVNTKVSLRIKLRFNFDERGNSQMVPGEQLENFGEFWSGSGTGHISSNPSRAIIVAPVDRYTISGKVTCQRPELGEALQFVEPLCDEGHPVAGANVQLYNRTTGAGYFTTTDSDGNYSFSNLPAGEYDVTVDGLYPQDSYFCQILNNAQYCQGPSVNIPWLDEDKIVDFKVFWFKLNDGLKLPLTGGMSADAFMIGGAAVLLVGLCGASYVLHRRRRAAIV